MLGVAGCTLVRIGARWLDSWNVEAGDDILIEKYFEKLVDRRNVTDRLGLKCSKFEVFANRGYEE